MPAPSPSQRRIKWSTIRKGIAGSIASAASTAVVHKRWAMRFDLDSTISMLLNSSEEIHSWMVTVEEVNPDVQKTGGTEYETVLNIKIWGFLSYDYGNDDTNSQDTFEDEVDDVIATLKAQGKAPYMFGISSNDGVEAIKDLVLPDSFKLDVMGFGEGYDIHVAQGIIQVRIVR